MSQDFVSAFMANLAGSGITLNPTLQSVFASILANQITTNDEGELVLGSSFDTLAQIFTFIATPEANRPDDGPLGYDADVIEQAKADSATEQGVELDDGLTNTNDSRTFTIESDVTSVTEGETVTLTVTASEASDTDQTLTYSVAGAAIAGDADSEADPLSDLGILNGQVTILAGETTATIELTPASDSSTEGLEGFIVNLLDSDFAITASSNTVAIQDPANAGQSFALTTGVDNLEGGAGNDTFIAQDVDVSGTQTQTFATLDNIDGGAGTDTFNLYDQTNAINFATSNVSNVEIVNVEGGSTVTLDTTNWAETETVNFNQTVGALAATASATQDVNVSNSDNTIDVAGGLDVTVTDAAADMNIKIGESGAGTTNAAGVISLTDTDQGTGNTEIDGGTDVNVTTTIDAEGAIADAGNLTIGANAAASGAVTVVQNTNHDGETGNVAQADIAVTGGSSVSITANLTSDAQDEDSDSDIVGGAITVTADSSTSTVTIVQNESVTNVTEAAVAGTTESASVTFGVLKEGDAIEIIDAGDATGLTFTASKDLTGAEVAAAFASLTSEDLQTAGGVTANGIFSGQLPADWTSGTADGATVVFTATTADTNMDDLDTDLTNTSTNSVDAVIVNTDGAAGTASDTSTNAVTLGAVRVDGDGNTGAITDLSIDGYNSADLGDTGDDLDALVNLTLANSEGAATVVTDNTSLTVNVNDVDNGVTIGNVTNITLNATTEASVFGLTASAVTDLVVNADVALDIGTGSTLSALVNVDVNGAGAVDLGDVSVNTYDSFDASGNTGGVTVTVEGDAGTVTGDIEEYIFSAGNDVIDVDATTGTEVDLDITAGDGDDSVTLASGVTAAGGTISGGNGTDILEMASADAATASGSAAFEATIDGFEKFSVQAAAANDTITMTNLDDISYVIADDAGDVATIAWDLTGLVLNETDTLDTSASGTVLFTATADGQGADDVIAALVNTTVTISGSDFNITNPSGNILQLAGATSGAFNVSSIIGTLQANDDSTDGVAAIDSGALTTDIDGTAASLTVDELASNGTLELNGSGGYTVNITDASTNSSDVLNIIANVATADEDPSIVTAANVETINLTAADTNVDEDSDGVEYESGDRDGSTILVVADTATALNIDGNSNLALTTTAADLETLDASSLTGALTYSVSIENLAVTTGSGNDVIFASANGAEVTTGEGDDRITIGDDVDLLTIDGGAGSDTFVIGTSASSNKSNYAVFENVGSGDVFDFADDTTFDAAEVTLSQGATESTQAYLDQAVTDLADNEIGWFQYNGNTFIVVDEGGDSASAFADGTDQVVMITGLVDLSTGASFNSSNGTLEIA